MSIFSAEALEAKHVLVTGATGGIGEAIVKVALTMGARVTATGRNEEKLRAFKTNQKDKRLSTIRADLAGEQERETLVAAAIDENGPIYGLVNAAGVSGSFGRDTLDKITEGELHRMMQLNWTATVLLTQRVYKDMEQGGAIVNISSLSGLRGGKGNTPYASSKFALQAFTQSFALEAIERGIRVNAVCPGYVDTAMGNGAILSVGKAVGNDYTEQRRLIEQQMPSGRITNPEEVANTATFLLTGAAKNIIGESIKITGGAYM